MAKKSIRKGERFSEDNLTIKRPGTGVSPVEWDKVLGMTADKNYSFDDEILI